MQKPLIRHAVKQRIPTDGEAMANVTPLHSQETVEGALRNALQIADAYAELAPRPLSNGDQAQADAFASIARLIRHALDQLGKPNEAAIQAAKLFVDAAGPEHWERQARDCAAAVISKQLRGVSP